MYSVKILGTPDINWVSQKNENVLTLQAPRDFVVYTKQVSFIEWDCLCETINVVGIPFFDKKVEHKLSLYYPQGTFAITGNRKLQIAFVNDTLETINIKQGCLLCYVKFETIEFFKLASRHNNSDKGLRSARIKIVFNNGKNCN